MKMKKWYLISVLSVISFNAFPFDSVEMIWLPYNNLFIQPINVDIDDSRNAVIQIKTLGTFRTNTRKYRCSEPGIRFNTGYADRVVFMAIPKKVELAQGLELSVSQGYGSNVAVETNVPEGYMATYSSYRTDDLSAGVDCPTSENEPSSDIPIPPTTINVPVTINEERAYSGVYSGNINIRVALYENFCHGNCFGYGVMGKDWFNTASAFPVSIPYNITIHSKCSFNASPIVLSHGSMTGQNADGNQTKPYNLNVTCTPGTSLSVKLLGAQKMFGKTDNYTQCGTGGMCELTFDNGKYDETMMIDDSKTLVIKSTYHLNDISKPIAESFEGSGVLQMLVN